MKKIYLIFSAAYEKVRRLIKANPRATKVVLTVGGIGLGTYATYSCLPKKPYSRVKYRNGSMGLESETNSPSQDALIHSLIKAGGLGLSVFCEIAAKKIANDCFRHDGDGHEVKPQDAGQNETPCAHNPICAPTLESFAESCRNAKAKGAPQSLFGKTIYAGNTCIIFSKPGIGKSILTTQLCISAATGDPSGVFPDEIRHAPQNVLLIDAEQVADDIYNRYCKAPEDTFPKNFWRLSDLAFNDIEDVLDCIRNHISGWNCNGVVVVDNLTCLCSTRSEQGIRDFFRSLKTIQNRFEKRALKLTFFVICHQTKNATELTLKALQGAGNIANFATTVIGLGQTNLGEDTKMLKILKDRQSKIPDKVYLLKLEEEPYFHFTRVGEANEQEVSAKCRRVKKSAPIPNDDNSQPTPSHDKLTETQKDEIAQKVKDSAKINSLAKEYHVNLGTIRQHSKRQLKKHKK
jgi:archaellum biogenesis ATPase FlaH